MLLRARRALVGAWRRRSPRGLVLLYHRIAGPRFDPQWLDVTPEHFAAQLDVLERQFTVLPLDEFERLRRAGRLPRRAVAITFDDGYADNLQVAAPALVARRLPATVFVTAGAVGSSREFWWDDAERIAFAAAPLPREMPDAELASSTPWRAADGEVAPAVHGWTVLDDVDPTPRHRLYRALCARLHALPTPERESRLAIWRTWAGVGEPGRASHRALTREELVALSSLPGLSIGAHTMTHPSLALLPAAEQQRELAESASLLSTMIGAPVTFAAYPYGTPGDVSALTRAVARDANLTVAFANTAGAAWRWSPRWFVPRVLVRDWDAGTFEAKMTQWFAS